MITQLEEGVLKCKKDCNKVKIACANCFRFHTCAHEDLCPLRGLSATDLIRILATRGVAGVIYDQGLPTTHVGGALSQYSVSQLAPAAMSEFVGRGTHLIRARDSLDTAIDTAARILGGGYVQSLFGSADANTAGANAVIVGGQSARLMSQYVGGFRKDRQTDDRSL